MREDFVEEQRSTNCSFLNKAKLFVPIDALGEVLWQKKPIAGCREPNGYCTKP